MFQPHSCVGTRGVEVGTRAAAVRWQANSQQTRAVFFCTRRLSQISLVLTEAEGPPCREPCSMQTLSAAAAPPLDANPPVSPRRRVRTFSPSISAPPPAGRCARRDGLITSGTVSFRPSRYDGGGMRYLRFPTGSTELDRLTPDRSPRSGTRKCVGTSGTDAAHVYGGLMATLTAGPSCAASPTRASRSAPSSDTPPARATPTRRP